MASSSSSSLLSLFFLFLPFLLSSPSLALHVLVLTNHETGSHQRSMAPFMAKLCSNGHRVTLLDTIVAPGRKYYIPPCVQLIEARIDLWMESGEQQNEQQIAQMEQHRREQRARMVFEQTFRSRFSCWWPACLAKHFDQGIVPQLIQWHPDQFLSLLSADPPDLLLVDDWFCVHCASLGHLFHSIHATPVAIFATTWPFPSVSDAVAIGRSWVSKAPLFPSIPSGPEDVFRPNHFAHRLFAFYENFAEHLLMNLLVESFNLPNVAKFCVPNFSWFEMYRRSAIQFSDSIDRMGWPMAQSIEMVNVGAHCKEPKELPSEFARFMEDPGSAGTVYVAFGTYPDWTLAPAHILDVLIGAFMRLSSYRIIFVYNGPPIPGLGKHIKLAKWAPQLEILAHPSTKAYITHGGQKSVKEGLCAAVPLIVMPLFAEQAHQAHLLLATGIGQVLNKLSLSADSVFNTIHRVLSDPHSLSRARHFRSLFLDRPMPALDEAVFRVERLMRGVKSGKQFEFGRRKGMQLGWAKFAHLDLAITGLLVILVGTARK